MEELLYSPISYLAILLVSLIGLGWLDYKFKLILFANYKAAIFAIFLAVLFFLVWDIAGIILNIFSTNQNYVSGVYIVTKDLPIEELLFLILLNYSTLLAWKIAQIYKGSKIDLPNT